LLYIALTHNLGRATLGCWIKCDNWNWKDMKEAYMTTFEIQSCNVTGNSAQRIGSFLPGIWMEYLLNTRHKHSHLSKLVQCFCGSVTEDIFLLGYGVYLGYWIPTFWGNIWSSSSRIILTTQILQMVWEFPY